MKTIEDIIEALENCLIDLKEHQETVTKNNESRTGAWIPIDRGTVNGKCSVCGYESHLYENDVYGERYCPNCGTKMREKE